MTFQIRMNSHYELSHFKKIISKNINNKKQSPEKVTKHHHANEAYKSI